jgi:hypothetical protein
MKMFDHLLTNLIVSINYELLCNVEIVMGLMCVLAMLKAMQSLNKFA